MRAGGERARVSAVCVRVQLFHAFAWLRLLPQPRDPSGSPAAAAAAPAARGGRGLSRSRRRRRGRRWGRAARAAAPPPRLAWAACFVSEIDKDAGNPLLNNVSGNFHVIPPHPSSLVSTPGEAMALSHPWCLACSRRLLAFSFSLFCFISPFDLLELLEEAKGG